MKERMTVEIQVNAGPAAGKVFTFHRPDCFLFGRALDARLSLPDDPFVSRQHFLLEISPPNCTITDLGSKNGLFVNGVRYGGRKPAEPGVKTAPEGVMGTHLADGDRISVGNTIMTISIRSGSIDERGKPTLDSSPGTASSIGEDSEAMRLLDELLSDAAGAEPPSDAPSFKGYRVEYEIGDGSMGKIYRAVCEMSGRLVAVKTMRPHIAATDDNVRLFRREVEVTRQLKHPNIVELIEYGKTGETFFFVIEYVDGMNMEAFVKSRGGTLSLKEAVPIMMGATEGLAYAHRAKIRSRLADGGIRTDIGIVHRDIKPENILLSETSAGWTAKVSDFGISKSFESAGLSDITMPGMVAGTPVYWPREQITHYRYLCPATDVFSMAAVFYEALTGHLVREGFDTIYARSRMKGQKPAISDFMRVLAENPPVPIRERNNKIPAPLAAVIDRALSEGEVPSQKDRMRSTLSRMRYPDAGSFRKHLIAALKECRGLS